MDFKKFLKIILLLISLSVFIISCNLNNDKPEINDLDSKKGVSFDSTSKNILKIAAISYPPFGYLDENDKYVGPGADLTREALNKMDMEYEIVVYPWSRIIELIESGEVDMVLDMYYSDERAEYIHFSKSKYGIYRSVLFCHKNFEFKTNFDGTLESLKDLKIGIVRDYHYGDEFNKAIDDKIIDVYPSNSSEENMKSLMNGRVDVALEEISVGKHILIEFNSSDQFKALEPPLLTMYTYVAFSKANNLSDIRDQFDLVMDELRKNGRVKEVFDKYNIDYWLGVVSNEKFT